MTHLPDAQLDEELELLPLPELLETTLRSSRESADDYLESRRAEVA